MRAALYTDQGKAAAALSGFSNGRISAQRFHEAIGNGDQALRELLNEGGVSPEFALAAFEGAVYHMTPEGRDYKRKIIPDREPEPARYCRSLIASPS